MAGEFDRLGMLIGEEGLERLERAHVAVFGIGGVGGYAVEALARSGVGKLTLIDGDTVSLSNLNRQIIALHSTLGQPKVEVARQRVLDINPNMCVKARAQMFMPGDDAPFDPDVNYVIDAIDMVSAKIALVELCRDMGVSQISCMGTGNKFDPTKLEVADIYSTDICPLCRVMRRELRRRGIPGLKVLYSREQPIQPRALDAGSRKSVPGSNAFVPPVAGLMLAREAVMHILGIGQVSAP